MIKLKKICIILLSLLALSHNAYGITPSGKKNVEIIDSVIHVKKIQKKSAAAKSSDETGKTKSEKESYLGSKKLSYLKKGYSVTTEKNIKKNQNYWGKGVSSNVKFPVHLAEWERFRRKKKK